ncbi:MAG TPA: DUF177 domain-containing protein [Bryobacteraceae bacterium]|nr:DUF177 domain-containing protein [Bryobacteraceae bacterium]
MLISLQELELRPVQFKVDIPAGEIEYDAKLKQASVLHTQGAAELVNHALGEIRIRGSLSVTIEAPCDRCLEAASFPVQKDFDLLYYPSDEYEAAGEEEIRDAESEVAYYEGDRLNLSEILREVVLLTLPMQVVCSESCKGICPACGQNRNVRDCHCRIESADDRWSKLRALRTELEPRH